jgi:hypothetical protein
VRQIDDNGVHLRDQLGPRARDAMFRMQTTLCEISTHLEALFDSVSKLILSAELEQESELFKDLSKVQAVMGETKEYVFTEMEISQQKFMLQDLELKWGMTLTKTGRLIKMQGNLHKVSPVHLLIDSLTLWLARPRTPSLTRLITHPRIFSLTHSPTHSPIRYHASRTSSTRSCFSTTS